MHRLASSSVYGRQTFGSCTSALDVLRVSSSVLFLQKLRQIAVTLEINVVGHKFLTTQFLISYIRLLCFKVSERRCSHSCTLYLVADASIGHHVHSFVAASGEYPLTFTLPHLRCDVGLEEGE